MIIIFHFCHFHPSNSHQWHSSTLPKCCVPKVALLTFHFIYKYLYIYMCPGACPMKRSMLRYIIYCTSLFLITNLFQVLQGLYKLMTLTVHNMLYLYYVFTLYLYVWFIVLTRHIDEILSAAPLEPAKVSCGSGAKDALTVSHRNTCQLLLFVSTAKAFLFQENLITFHYNSDKWWKTRPN